MAPSSLDDALVACRSVLLSTAVVGITKSTSVPPHSESFWRFDLRPIVADRALLRPFADALATIYGAAVDSGALPAARLAPLTRTMVPLADALNARTAPSGNGRVTLLDDGVLIGSVLEKSLRHYRDHGRTPVGVYSVIGMRRCPRGESTIGEVAAFHRLLRVSVTDKQDLARRLVAFGKHRDWLAPSDDRYGFTLEKSYAYKTLRDGGDIAAALPPMQYAKPEASIGLIAS